eukprot:CFRG2168T1
MGDLRYFVTEYMDPLKNNNILSQEEFAQLFGNISQVVDFQTKFSEELYHTVGLSSDQQRVGDIFMKYAEKFKAYTMYCANHPKAVDMLGRVVHRKQFKEFEKKTAFCNLPVMQGGRNNSLSSLIIKPVQRICKYPLLLEKITTSTPKQHVDYPQLTLALAMMEALACYINEMTRKMEGMSMMIDIQKQIDNWQGLSLMGCGVLLRQGLLAIAKVKDAKNPKKMKESLILMMAKRLVWCTKKGVSGRNVFGRGIMVADLEITERVVDNNPLMWKIVDKSEWIEFVLKARTKVERDEWVELIQTAIDDFAREHASTPRDKQQLNRNLDQLSTGLQQPSTSRRSSTSSSLAAGTTFLSGGNPSGNVMLDTNHEEIPSFTNAPAYEHAEICTGCLLDIESASEGQMIGDRAWHMACMMCEACGTIVGGEGATVHRYGDKLFCTRHKSSACVCCHCGNIIDFGRNDTSALAIRQTGDVWHTQCCRCVKCGTKFDTDDEVYVVNNQIYCEIDFYKLPLECAVCTKRLRSNEPYAMDGMNSVHAKCAPKSILRTN